MIGLCKLCGLERVLKNSHLIPKAAYRLIRGSTQGADSNPVMLLPGEGVAIQTTEQIADYLLCEDCEQLLSRQGENDLGRLWASRESFPALKLIDGKLPVAKLGDVDVFHPDLLGDKSKRALYYFAVSVFWRAHVWDWKRQKVSYGRALGTTYEQSFRSFLLGESTSVNMLLNLSINKDDSTRFAVHFPRKTRIYGTWLHRFEVPGLKFVAYVGGNVSPVFSSVFENLQTNMILTAYDFRSGGLYQDAARAAPGLKLKGMLSKDLRFSS